MCGDPQSGNTKPEATKVDLNSSAGPDVKHILAQGQCQNMAPV